MRNDDKEQKGLEILDTDNLDKLLAACMELPEDFKKQLIERDKNGLTCLILKVLEKKPELVKFEYKDTIKEGTYLESLQLAFSRLLGFEDVDHLCKWLGANPQWAPERWCGGSTAIFNNSEHQGFGYTSSTTYGKLINILYELSGNYKFKVYEYGNYKLRFYDGK